MEQHSSPASSGAHGAVALLASGGSSTGAQGSITRSARRLSVDAAPNMDLEPKSPLLVVTVKGPATAVGSSVSTASSDKLPLPSGPYQLSWRRWLVLVLFGLSSLLSAFMWISLAPIYKVAQTTFAATSEQINFISLTFLIGYLPASVVSMVLMEKYGLRTNLLVGFFLDLACAGVKWGGMLTIPDSNATDSDRQRAYAIVLFGQCLGSAGQPLLLNLCSRISSDFFGDSERDVATIALSMINVAGQMLGSLLPPYLISTQNDLQAMFLWTFVPTAVIFVVSVFTLTDRPPSPPSASAAAQWEQRDSVLAQRKASSSGGGLSVMEPLKAVWRDTALLLRDRNFGLLLAGFSAGTGAAWALLTVQGQLIQPCGYDDTTAGNSGAALLGVGVIASFAVGPLLTKYKRYSLFQKLVMVGSLLAVIFALAVNRPNNEGLIYVAWCCCGLMLQPLLPISLEHAAEMTFPLSADSSAALLLICANLVGTALILGLGRLLALPVSADCTSVVTPAAGLILAFMVTGVALTMPIRPVLKRHLHSSASVVSAHAASAGTPPAGTIVAVGSVNAAHAHE